MTSVILKHIGIYRAGPSRPPQAGHGLISVCHIARYCVDFWLCSAPLSVALVAIREIEYEAIPADMHRDILFSILLDIRRYQPGSYIGLSSRHLGKSHSLPPHINALQGWHLVQGPHHESRHPRSCAFRSSLTNPPYASAHAATVQHALRSDIDSDIAFDIV